MNEADGYAGPLTLGELLKIGWFTAPEHWQRLCEIVVDGTKLLDTRPRFRTPLPGEVRYSKKFSEVLVAAHVFARMDCGGVEVFTAHERPRSSS